MGAEESLHSYVLNYINHPFEDVPQCKNYLKNTWKINAHRMN
jgi:hypothetical protein